MDHHAFAQLLGNYGEFVGAIAVVVTLAYLAVQIRQNTASMNESRRMAITQSQIDWTSMFNSSMMTMSDSAYFPEIWIKAHKDFASLTEDERVRLEFNMTAMLARLDALHLQYQNGFLDDETFEATFKSSVKRFAPVWKSLGASYELRRPSFRREVEAILAEVV